jgi:FixJ family two-component response regulator
MPELHDSNCKILLVDDDAGFRKGVERLLKANGFEVHTFSSAEDLQASEDLLHASCLILDIHLGGISGLEFQWQQLKAGSTVPVIFITGNGSEETQKATMAAGGIAYLEKPCPARRLLAAVASAVHSHGSSPAG